MFKLEEYLSDKSMWQGSRKCTLKEILLSESSPKTDCHATMKILLEKEQETIRTCFSCQCPKAMSGDGIEKLRVKMDGGEAKKTADIYVFQKDVDDPLYLIECKYRYSFSSGGDQGIKIRSIFNDLLAKFLSSRLFLEEHSRRVDNRFFVVTNSLLAPILKNEFIDLCDESGIGFLFVVDNEDLYERLSVAGVELVEGGQ